MGDRSPICQDPQVGFDPIHGVRPLTRAIQREVEIPPPRGFRQGENLTQEILPSSIRSPDRSPMIDVEAE